MIPNSLTNANKLNLVVLSAFGAQMMHYLGCSTDVHCEEQMMSFLRRCLPLLPFKAMAFCQWMLSSLDMFYGSLLFSLIGC